MVFKLCIRTVWTCVRLLCQIYVNKSDLSEDCLPKEAIIDFVSEACSKSAFYLDNLHQHGARETEKLHVFILENWPEAEDLIKKLPDPTPIVKQWVKVPVLALIHITLIIKYLLSTYLNASDDCVLSPDTTQTS